MHSNGATSALEYLMAVNCCALVNMLNKTLKSDVIFYRYYRMLWCEFLQ